jgi:hypothetical protein
VVVQTETKKNLKRWRTQSSVTETTLSQAAFSGSVFSLPVEGNGKLITDGWAQMFSFGGMFSARFSKSSVVKSTTRRKTRSSTTSTRVVAGSTTRFETFSIA